MIKLKNIITEQADKFDAKAVAKTIYDAKGYVSDDEQLAIDTVLTIPTATQLDQVETHFVKLSEGRTLSEYLFSFLNNLSQNLKVLRHLYKLSKNNALHLESYVYPYAKQLMYQYKSPIAKVGSAILKKQGQTKTVGLKDSGALFKWFEKYLGAANYEKWVKIVQDPQYIDNPFNAYEAEEQFIYGKSKAVSSEVVLVGQLVVGAIATVATAGAAAPAVVGWIGMGTAAGMGLYDAAQEYNLGNKTTAGIMAIIEMLPVVSKIPLVKNAVRSAGKSLATKLANGTKYFTSQERYLLRKLDEYINAIEDELTELEKNVTNQSKLPPSTDIPTPRGKESVGVEKIYTSPSGIHIGTYGKTAAENPAAIFGIIDKAGVSKYIGYYAVEESGETIYKLTAKLEWEGDGKQLGRVLTAMSKIIPDHILFESTSISSDGIKWWASQIKNGYKPTSKYFTVPLNNAGTRLKVTHATNFNPARFPTKVLAQKAIDEIKKQPWFKKIPGAELILKAPTSPGGPFAINVTLPELQSTTKSLNALGIAKNMLAPAVSKSIESKE